jgi:iron complex transport system substrate-binding protein
MRVLFTLILAVLLSGASACGATTTPTPAPTQQPSASVAAAFPATVTDFQNRSVNVPKRPDRIVSIGPSITEFVFALGAGPRVVGVDDFSDEPAAANQVEKVGAVKVNLEKVVSL